MSRILLAAVGSYGDVTPLAGLGAALQRRGHEVILITNDRFAPLARQSGLGFASLGTAEEYESALTARELWRPHQSFDTLCRRMLVPVIGRTCSQVSALHVPGRTLLVATALMFGARIAQERFGVPLVTIVSQPLWLRSRFESARGPFGPPAWIGPWGRAARYRLMDALADRRLAGPVNACRAESGLPPVSRLFARWWISPLRAIGLWPEWFARKMPDWPDQLTLTGFLPFDDADAGPMIDPTHGGTRPVVFSPGSAMKHARDFFAVAVEVCRLLGRPGVFITRYREQLPDALPDFIRHHEYIPLGSLLPRAAAIVHHGGLQTIAQALAAGVPQLIRPTSHDQFDNAHRLSRLGVSATIRVRNFRAGAVTAALGHLLDDPAVAANCRRCAALSEAGDVMSRTCDLVEEVAASASGANRPTHRARPLAGGMVAQRDQQCDQVRDAVRQGGRGEEPRR